MREGGCQCGNLRYECAERPLKIYVCHCRECRKQSASEFGVSFFVPKASFRVTRGTPRIWRRTADSGHILDCAFCPDCGTRGWHANSASPDMLSIKAGSLDELVDLSQATHIWTSRKLLGVVIPSGTQQFPEEPA